MSEPTSSRRKKLIEVAIPLDVINEAAVRESYIYRGNPSALHKWWAQRPLSTARAVLFAQLIDDPSSLPDEFPTATDQEAERRRLFALIKEFVSWEATNRPDVLRRVHTEIEKSVLRAQSCGTRAGGMSALRFWDPFAGGATLPIEAQRLGLHVTASDLNPVAVLINKVALEIPAAFSRQAPVNPDDCGGGVDLDDRWDCARGLARDVKYYGRWLVDAARQRLAGVYPDVRMEPTETQRRPALRAIQELSLSPIAWIWARTVRSPNPAFSERFVPLATTFVLSTRPGRETYVEPQVANGRITFLVKDGVAPSSLKSGTKLSRGANFRCLLSGTPITADHVRSEARAGRMGSQLMAVVVDSPQGRVYLSPSSEIEAAATSATPSWTPSTEFYQEALGFRIGKYGMSRWEDLFTSRQLLSLSTICDLVREAHERIRGDATAWQRRAGRDGGGNSLTLADDYARAISTLLAFAVSKSTDYNCSLVPWYTKEDRPGHLFSKQAIPMVWDYVELNPLSRVGGSFEASVDIVAEALSGCPMHDVTVGSGVQGDARTFVPPQDCVVSTDPPYYDNIGYADLSDFFYPWLRRCLQSHYPELFATLETPKGGEIVATPGRHGGKDAAEEFFVSGMTDAMRQIAKYAHPSFPVTIYYAFKQSETESGGGAASTGWEAFLEAVLNAGLAVTGTWPIRTERSSRSRGIQSNALASSVVLVCRPRDGALGTIGRREFLGVLRGELAQAVALLQRENLAPVDLAQAAIGPGMGVYTRYANVLDADGKPIRVREALTLINQTLDDALADQEGDFDGDTRWALTWFERSGFEDGEYGIAEQLSKSKNTSVAGMVDAGIVESKRGRVRLYRPEELPRDWDPSTDSRLTAWETVHHLIRVLTHGGESAAAQLVAKLGAKAEVARELAYRLYTICERKRRAADALAYNGLVQSWPEIARLASASRPVGLEEQAQLL